MILLQSVNEADCLDHQHRRTSGTTGRHHSRRSAYRASGLVRWPVAAREVTSLSDCCSSHCRHSTFKVGCAPHCCRPAARSEYRHPTRCSNTELQIRPCEADACHSTMAGSSISIRMRSKPSQLLSKSMGNFSMVAIARSRVSPAASCGCLQRTSPHLEAKMRTHRAALRSACHPGNFAASRSIFSMFGGVLSKAAALAINAAAIGPCR